MDGTIRNVAGRLALIGEMEAFADDNKRDVPNRYFANVFQSFIGWKFSTRSSFGTTGIIRLQVTFEDTQRGLHEANANEFIGRMKVKNPY